VTTRKTDETTQIGSVGAGVDELLSHTAYSQSGGNDRVRSAMPANYKELIQDYLNTHLKDPYSAAWKYPPVQGWVRNAPVQGSQLVLGWKVVCLVNAKNSFGGFNGNTPYLFMIRDGAIAFEVSGEDEMNTSLLDGYR
jgi:hypothetical protein